MQLMQVVKETQVESEPWTKPGEQVIWYHLTMEITWKLQGNDWILIYQICVASGSLQLSSYVQHFFCLSYNWKLQIPMTQGKNLQRIGTQRTEIGHLRPPRHTCNSKSWNQWACWHIGIYLYGGPIQFSQRDFVCKKCPSKSSRATGITKPFKLAGLLCQQKHASACHQSCPIHIKIIQNKWHPCFLLQAQVQFISSKSKLCIWLSMHILMVGTRSRLVDLEVHPICPSKCPHQITQTVFSLASWESSFT